LTGTTLVIVSVPNAALLTLCPGTNAPPVYTVSPPTTIVAIPSTPATLNVPVWVSAAAAGLDPSARFASNTVSSPPSALSPVIVTGSLVPLIVTTSVVVEKSPSPSRSV